MTQKTFLIICLVLGLILIAWLYVGYRNYINYYKELLSYERNYKKYKELETVTTDMYDKADLFLKSQNLENAYPNMHAVYLELSNEKDKQSYLSKTKTGFFLLGPLYNIL